jgi:hypothetical protein
MLQRVRERQTEKNSESSEGAETAVREQIEQTE